MAWAEVIGQELAKRIFQAHVASGCVPNAYLLAGPEGVGKRTLALEMAKALNCDGSGEPPCDACRSCLQIGRLTHPDVHGISPGGASDQIKIEEVRTVLGRMVLKPFSARVQITILDGAERLTEEAGNALLKLLEEPPRHALFILMTAHLPHCLPTIVSRCQVIRCRRLLSEVVAEQLARRSPLDRETLRIIAQRSRGSVARAAALAGTWREDQGLRARCAGAGPAAWLESPLPHTRQEVVQLLDAMVAWLRDLALAKSTGAPEGTGTAQPEELRRQAEAVDIDHCLETAFALIDLRDSIEQFASPRVVSALAREKWLNLMAVAPNG